MAGDMLNGGTPKRLLLKDGQWTLDIVRQVAIDRSVYRPQTQKIEGRDFILAYLQRNPQLRELAGAANQILNAPEGEGNKSLDAVNGEWVPSVLAPSYIEQLKRRQRANGLEALRLQLLKVQTECVRLRHSHSQLLKRVEALEGLLGGDPNAAAGLAARVAAKDQASVGAEAGDAKSAEKSPEASSATQPEPAESAESAEAESAEAEPAVSEDAFRTIKLPPGGDFIRCIEQLIGGDVSAKEVTEAVDLSAPSESFWLSTLVDENDAEVGAVIMNIQATAYLGGTLLMIPEDELKEQVQKVKPSEDSLAASSEVCNALAGAVNSFEGNPTIRSNFMELLDLKKHAWMTEPALTTNLQDSFEGRTIILAR